MPGPAWIVLPTYCEAENLEPMADALRAVLPADARILVVDDASPDGTGAIADRLAAADPRVAVLHRAGKEGLGPAYVAGFGHALAHGAGAVVEMDCDFSHDPAVVPVLLAALERGADLALGSRYVGAGRVENWTAWRRAVSRGGCLYARAVLRVPVRDLTGGFKAFRADTLRAIDYRTARAKGYAFQVELTYRALRARPAGHRGADRLPRAARGGVEDDGRDRARGRLARARPPPPVPRRRCRSGREVSSEQLAVVRGWADTRATLRTWQRRPLPVVGAWAAASLGVAVLLLTSTWIVAVLSVPDPLLISHDRHGPSGATSASSSTATGSSSPSTRSPASRASWPARRCPIVAEGYSGLWRRIHDKAGKLAMGFVAAATLFSLTTQAYALGMTASSLAESAAASRPRCCCSPCSRTPSRS